MLLALAQTVPDGGRRLPEVHEESWKCWATMAVVAAGLLVLVTKWIKEPFVMLGILVTLMWLRVLDSEHATLGFGSPAVLTVMGVISIRYQARVLLVLSCR